MCSLSNVKPSLPPAGHPWRYAYRQTASIYRRKGRAAAAAWFDDYVTRVRDHVLAVAARRAAEPNPDRPHDP